MTTNEITLPCTRGNAKLKITSRSAGQGHTIYVLTGKRRKWDVLHWSYYNHNHAAIQGLYRGRYADAIVFIPDLHKAIKQLLDNDDFDLNNVFAGSLHENGTPQAGAAPYCV